MHITAEAGAGAGAVEAGETAATTGKVSRLTFKTSCCKRHVRSINGKTPVTTLKTPVRGLKRT